jgi:hypothetical protein
MCIVNTVVELTIEEIKYYQELYVLYRDYIKHEDNLINARISWMISIQSFLIATFGFSYQKKFEIINSFINKINKIKVTDKQLLDLTDFIKLKDVKEIENILDKLYYLNIDSMMKIEIKAFQNLIFRYDIFLWILTVIGMLTSFSALRSTSAAHSSIDELSIKWKEIIRNLKLPFPQIVGGGSFKANQHGKILSERLPYFFLFIWGIILIFVIGKII